MPAQLGAFTGCCGAGILYGIQNVPTEKQIKSFRENAKAHRWGVVFLIDNEQELLLCDYSGGLMVQDKKSTNGGKRWSEMIRNMGFRVDVHYLGGNPNHNELAPHFLTLYIWYLNKEGDNKESVYVRKQEERSKDVPPSGELGVLTGKGVAARLRRGRVPRMFGDIEF